MQVTSPWGSALEQLQGPKFLIPKPPPWRHSARSWHLGDKDTSCPAIPAWLSRVPRVCPSSLAMYACAKFVSAPALAAPLLTGLSSARRNPSLKQQLFSYAILGFALSEAMGLFCLMVTFLILFAM
ncbi:PREDICTED: LOW QUALITY PROTEIN: ATP synthase F(0) complex subunit C2, mitochondrial [Aptenodytes forsteri]|uniref:LOW QUALITY PROTEIN: ATP synthase F(0) complex subunit C2, mitochondrial n=1 Tax=Aptenodytes forsteri TaxID=9233 RepID=UPI00090575A3|nr:PREDICTED: LOW QUALITY PROTEIN: ATP synthase F(0) complex subunit C2, mitochondrial [Aptenodytes forsteri]